MKSIYQEKYLAIQQTTRLHYAFKMRFLYTYTQILGNNILCYVLMAEFLNEYCRIIIEIGDWLFDLSIIEHLNQLGMWSYTA